MKKLTLLSLCLLMFSAAKAMDSQEIAHAFKQTRADYNPYFLWIRVMRDYITGLLKRLVFRFMEFVL